MFNSRSDNHGFTLVELLTAVSIMSVVLLAVGTLFSNFGKQMVRMQKKADEGIIYAEIDAMFKSTGYCDLTVNGQVISINADLELEIPGFIDPTDGDTKFAPLNGANPPANTPGPLAGFWLETSRIVNISTGATTAEKVVVVEVGLSRTNEYGSMIFSKQRLYTIYVNVSTSNIALGCVGALVTRDTAEKQFLCERQGGIWETQTDGTFYCNLCESRGGERYPEAPDPSNAPPFVRCDDPSGNLPNPGTPPSCNPGALERSAASACYFPGGCECCSSGTVACRPDTCP